MKSYITTTIRMAAESYMADYVAQAKNDETRNVRAGEISGMLSSWVFSAIINTMSDVKRICPGDDAWCGALRVGTCVGAWLTMCDVDVNAVEARLGDSAAVCELMTSQLMAAGYAAVVNGYPRADGDGDVAIV